MIWSLFCLSTMTNFAIFVCLLHFLLSIGMVAGSYFWGCLADVQGRRLALLYALFIYAIIEIASSLVTTYWLFLLLKFLSGWV